MASSDRVVLFGENLALKYLLRLKMSQYLSMKNVKVDLMLSTQASCAL